VALVARDISYTYGAGTSFGVQALRSVDLTLAHGELLVIAGTTGSGKSTLLRVLAGLLAPHTGTVEADGITPGTGEARGRVALVFQNPEMQFFAETILADVSFGPRNLGASDPETRAREAISAVGLDPEVFGSRSPFTLSGGEARRVAIAGALAMHSPYLLLDEPTAGLDAQGRRDVLAAIDAQRARAGVAVVTHDPEEFLPTASAVLALSEGEVAFTGNVAELLADPSAYLAAGLRLPEVVRAQLMARERGMMLTTVSFDPHHAAAGLLAAREATS
jgi:energy-coupling factor transport system ATP-binding protein